MNFSIAFILQRSLIKALVGTLYDELGIFRQKIYCSLLYANFLVLRFSCSCKIAKLHHLQSDSILYKIKLRQTKSMKQNILIELRVLEIELESRCDIVAMTK